MDKDYFNKIRILDGGMGQELLHRGLKPKGTLWSAQALIDKDCHQMVIDAHLDFINAGAEVILIGEQDGQGITVEEISKWAETIPYEILTNLNERLPRTYLN